MSQRSQWTIIEGRHPIAEALRAGRKMREIVIDEGVREHGLETLYRLAAEKGVPVRRIPKEQFRQIHRTAAPQGVVAFARPIEYVSLNRLIQKEQGESPGFLLICDGIVDPHNLGALIRTADAAGCDGVIIAKHGAVGLTETVLKASAGAAEYVPVAQMTNLARTIETLKKEGYWIAGAAMDGRQNLWDVDLKGSIAIVIGSEGSGMSRLVEEKCDFLVSIPMLGHVNSLNASVAGALLMYEVLRQRSSNEA